MTRNGAPFSVIGIERGEAELRSLADVSPAVDRDAARLDRKEQLRRLV
jgi:hypothetical protein